MFRSRVVPSALVLGLAAVSIAATVPHLLPQDPEKPTAHHARLHEMIGTWEGKLTWFAPDGTSGTTTAKDEIHAVGPFWIQTHFESNLGVPFLGSGNTGYDPKTKKYQGTWVDSMASYLALMEGEYDEKRELLIMRWELPHPETGKMTKQRYELAHRGDEYTMTFFEGDGEAGKNMLIEMSRVKPDGQK